MTPRKITVAIAAVYALMAFAVMSHGQAIRGGNETATSLSTAVECSGTTLVINEAGKDCDVRIESDADADLLFLNGGTNTVGINEQTPAAKLEVTNDATQTIIVQVSSNNGTGLFVVENGGDVGIGTTAPAQKLHMSSGVFLLDGTTPAIQNADCVVGTPSYAFSGNSSNTGFYSPAEDEMSFSANGGRTVNFTASGISGATTGSWFGKDGTASLTVPTF